MRALDALRWADAILCEDTRVTRKLLAAHGIGAKELIRLNERSEKSLEYILNRLQGKNAALVSDSGTPGISDPGRRLIQFLVSHLSPKPYCLSPRIIPIPGPSACTALLSVSGLGRDGFIFLGFLPRSKGKIRRELSGALATQRAVVFHESPFRILNTLKIIAANWPQVRLAIGRELTKEFEEILRGDPGSLAENLGRRDKILGELTVAMEQP